VTCSTAGQALVHVENAIAGTFLIISRDTNNHGRTGEWKRITLAAGANDVTVPMFPQDFGLGQNDCMNREVHVYFYDASSTSTS